jgi:hypothetical protein
MSAFNYEALSSRCLSDPRSSSNACANSRACRAATSAFAIWPTSRTSSMVIMCPCISQHAIMRFSTIASRSSTVMFGLTACIVAPVCRRFVITKGRKAWAEEPCGDGPENGPTSALGAEHLERPHKGAQQKPFSVTPLWCPGADGGRVFQVAGEYRTGVGSYLVPGDRKPRIRLQGGLSLGVDSVGLPFSKTEKKS